MKYFNKTILSNGFTTIELLITLFIAAAFLLSGFQLYAVVVKDGGESNAKASANNVVYDYLQDYKTYATKPCTAKTPVTDQSVIIDGLSSATISVVISCPYSTSPNVSKIVATLTYNYPQRTVSNSTFLIPDIKCPSGFVLVPGSATYGTSDFCVMKYEAKNDGAGRAVSVAAGKPWVSIAQLGVSLNVSQGKAATAALLTDGVTDLSTYYNGGDSSGGPGSVTVDLGSIYSITSTKVWHYSDGRTYYGTKTEVSTDNITWSTVFDSSVSGTYPETSAGKTTTFKAMNVRYIRDWVNGSTSNAGHHWIEIQAFETFDAINKSALACEGCHLLTAAEWLTIVQNALSVPSNWSSGVVGVGYVYSGHNDNAPTGTLVADTNDANGYSGETNVGGNQRRTLTLTNGSVIWDIAGNAYEITSTTITSGKPGVLGGGGAWRDWTAVTYAGTMVPNPFPANTGITGANLWNSATNGIGKIYSNSDLADLKIIVFGGGWDAYGNAGVLSLSLGDNTYTSNSYLSFRAAK